MASPFMGKQLGFEGKTSLKEQPHVFPGSQREIFVLYIFERMHLVMGGKQNEVVRLELE